MEIPTRAIALIAVIALLLVEIRTVEAEFNITTDPETASLTQIQQLEILEIVLDAEDEVSSIAKENFTDALVAKSLARIMNVTKEGDFSQIMIDARKKYSLTPNKLIRMEPYLRPTTKRRTLHLQDLLDARSFADAIKKRRTQLYDVQSFLRFMEGEMAKNVNDSEILPENDKDEFAAATLSYSEGHYDEAREKLLNIKIQMDFRGLAHIKMGHELLQRLNEGNFSALLLHDTLESAKDEFSVAYYDNLLNVSNISSDPEYTSLVMKLKANVEKRPGDEYVGIDYNAVRGIVKEMSYMAIQMYRINESIGRVKTKMELYRSRGVNVSEPEKLFNSGLQSFAEERYDEAESLVTKADSGLESGLAKLAISGVLARESVGFFKKNLRIIMAIVIFAIVFGPVIYRRLRLATIQRKINSLNLENTVLVDLIKKAQTERFQAGTIDDPTYHIKLDKYMERISKIKSILPVLGDIHHRYEKPTKVEFVYYKAKGFILKIILRRRQ